ncbi:MAG: hypothetical protein EHM28_06240 [Spirochaetaceae bacterium]|nr:MAG: hypothetical protein EHM28_06240 [Spirochaetaceae bacterium]
MLAATLKLLRGLRIVRAEKRKKGKIIWKSCVPELANKLYGMLVQRASLIKCAVRNKYLPLLLPYKRYFIFGGAGLSLMLFVILAMAGSHFPYDVKTLLQGERPQVMGTAGGIELGFGQLATIRNQDIEYILGANDSIQEIAYLYGLRPAELLLYNGLGSFRSTVAGQKIVIPTLYNITRFLNTIDRSMLVKLDDEMVTVADTRVAIPQNIRISVNKQYHDHALTAIFSVDTPLLGKDISYNWDLGDGSRLSKKLCIHTYNVPGIYIVRLSIRDKSGNLSASNKLYINVDHQGIENYQDRLYLTVNNVGELLGLDGPLVQAKDFLGRVSQPVHFVERVGERYYYQADASGYFLLKFRKNEKIVTVSLFVSPRDTIHSDRSDVDWYFTQYGTGLSNCGPTTVSIGIGWATGKIVQVEDIRNQIGWVGNGSTSMGDLQKALELNEVKSFFTNVASVDDFCRIIDRQNIAIIAYHCGKISQSEGEMQNDSFGGYYTDSVGHYAVIKGYTRDKEYFVVYDPLPSDWGINGLRYGDGQSMIGRNRYYPVEEIMNAMSAPTALEISR